MEMYLCQMYIYIPLCFLSAGAHNTLHTEYGMPSSHSQFMWFFVVYCFLFLYLR